MGCKRYKKQQKNESLSQHACHPSETKTKEQRAQMKLTTGSMQSATKIHNRYWLQKFIKNKSLEFNTTITHKLHRVIKNMSL